MKPHDIKDKTMDEIMTVLADMASRLLNISPDRIEPSTLILEELNTDSLDIVELLAEIEDLYGIYIPDSEVINMRTVGDVAKYIEQVKNNE